jgi:uncharacterized protein
MLYRRFGRTNLQMPLFSCGGMRYQFKWQDTPLNEIPPDNQSNLESTVRRAVALGINHIETARGYGSSERQLAEVLPAFPREKLIVQTKVAPVENADDFIRHFEDSLSRLKLQYVDLLALHGINHQPTLHWSIRPGGCLAAARKLQQRGLVRHVGFSTHGPTDIILRAIQHDADGGFDYVNLHWFYIFQKNWPAIEQAAQRDMGVFIISPSDKGGMLYDPPQKLLDLCHPLHPIVFNNLFCLSHPQVHTLSIGAARPSDFDLHVQSAQLLDRADERIAPIMSNLRQAYRQAVDPDLLDPFHMGLPEWDQTPGQINIPIILWLQNLLAAYDMKKYGQMRYNLLGNADHWFPGNTAKDLDQIDLTPVLKNIPAAPKIPALLKTAHTHLHTAPQQRLSKND